MKRKNIFILLASVILLILIQSCGLASYTIADAPVVTNSTDTSIFSFRAPSNDNNIYGYKIYYKIYAADSNDIASDKATITDVDNVLFGTPLVSELNTLDFQNLNIGSVTDPSSIVLASDLAGGEECAIDFSANDGAGEVTVNGISVGFPLRVALDTTITPNEYKKFINNVDSSDTDRNGVSSGTTYSVSFVAFSYVSSIITTCEHSKPAFLGTLTGVPNS